MAGTKISALTAGAALGGTEAIPAVQSAATVKITAAQIKTFTSASPTLVTPVLGAATGTSLALGGATIGSNALAVTGTSQFGGNIGIGFSANGSFSINAAGAINASQYSFSGYAGGLYWPDAGLFYVGAGSLRFGYADAASPVAQTIKFQDVVAGTSDTAGVNATIQAPAGTGTGAGGSLIFQVAPAGSSGSAKNAWATALTIGPTGAATFNGQVMVYTMRVDNINNNNNTRTFLTFSGAADSTIFGTGMTNPMFQFGAATSAAPALRRNGVTLEAKLADNSAFTAIQGKLTTDTAYTAGDPTTTGYLVVYDSTGTAYRVPALLN